MKRIINTTIVAVVAVTLFGCGSSSGTTETADDNKDSINAIDEDTFLGFFRSEELTLDNYKEYITIDEYPVIDEFGEETGNIHLLAVKKNNVVGFSDDAALHFQYTEVNHYFSINEDTGEEVPGAGSFSETILEIDDAVNISKGFGYIGLVKYYYPGGGYTCLLENGESIKTEEIIDKVKGTVYLFEADDNAWNNDETGLKFIRVNNQDTYSYVDYYEDGRIIAYNEDGSVAEEFKVTEDKEKKYNLVNTYEYFFFEHVKSKL